MFTCWTAGAGPAGTVAGAGGRRTPRAAGWRRSDVACRGRLAPTWLRGRATPAVGDHENGRDPARFRGIPFSSRRISVTLPYRNPYPEARVLATWVPRLPQALPSLAEPLLNAALIPVAAWPGQFELVTDRTAAVSAERPD